jgi:hypothetical protein
MRYATFMQPDMTDDLADLPLDKAVMARAGLVPSV